MRPLKVEVEVDLLIIMINVPGIQNLMEVLHPEQMEQELVVGVLVHLEREVQEKVEEEAEVGEETNQDVMVVVE